VFSFSPLSSSSIWLSCPVDLFVLGAYRLFLAPRTPQNQDISKLKLRLCFAEVERTIYNAIVSLHQNSLTQDSKESMTKMLTEDISSSSPPSSSVSSGTSSSSQFQLMNGLIFFEIFRFFDLLKPMFLSARHLSSSTHHSRRWPWSSIFWSTQSPIEECEKCSLSLSGIGVLLDNEFDGIRRDLLDLLNPRIEYQIKLEYLKRMRFTHKSLS
jgi:hypothetical protein